MEEKKVRAEMPPKSEWGPGPWQEEPDTDAWRSPHGFPCVMRRGSMGAWCGYVGVPPGHPWHGKDWGSIDVEVHGGLTYAEKCNEWIGVCHVPAPGESDNFWWVGFDCAHWMDLNPVQEALRSQLNMPAYERPEEFRDVYRTLAYVKAETEDLARQAKEAVA